MVNKIIILSKVIAISLIACCCLYAQDQNNNIIKNIIDTHIDPQTVIEWVASNVLYDQSKNLIYIPLRLICKQGFSIY